MAYTKNQAQNKKNLNKPKIPRNMLRRVHP